MVFKAICGRTETNSNKGIVESERNEPGKKGGGGVERMWKSGEKKVSRMSNLMGLRGDRANERLAYSSLYKG